MIITIDGPASSGKTSLSRILSEKLNFKILHTGLIYRAIAKKSYINNINIEDKNLIIEIASKINPSNLEDSTLTEDLYGNLASKLAKYAEVRIWADKIQHNFAKNNQNVIIEGRDAGTAVFPNADLKIYITANAEVRATRRFKELQEKGKKVIYDDILNDLLLRDKNDIERKASPLKKANDAVEIDTSLTTKEESLQLILSLVKNHLKNSS